MAYKTEAEWIAAQPNTTGMTPMQSKVALESWQMQRPNYANPMDYQTFGQYISEANPSYRIGADVGNDLQNQANFYGMTIENYQNALAGDQTKPMGQFQQVYGNQLLSPLQQVAAQTARGQGIGTMSPEVAALAKANPDVFNAASQKWSDYFKTTFPQSLEYESVLAGPTKYGTTGVTMPKVSDANSQFLLDPVSMQIVANPNYKQTSKTLTANDVTNIIGGRNTASSTSGGKSAGLTWALNNGMTQDQFYKNIFDWVLKNPNATDVEMQTEMDRLGISPEDVANATGGNLADITSRYSAVTGIDPVVAGQLRQLMPNFAKSKQLASELVASRPSTQSIVEMIQGKTPTSTASNASLANVLSLIGK